MAWNDKYWDIISNLYWTPRYLGLKSIPRDQWHIDGDRGLDPSRTHCQHTSGPLLLPGPARSAKQSCTSTVRRKSSTYRPNLVFSIVGDEVISRLLCQPLRISDPGPFESIGREIGLQYGWRKSENVTQQDGFFVSPSSLIGVELKLGSTSWPEQIAKYVALIIWEEAFSYPRKSRSAIHCA